MSDVVRAERQNNDGTVISVEQRPGAGRLVRVQFANGARVEHFLMEGDQRPDEVVLYAEQSLYFIEKIRRDLLALPADQRKVVLDGIELCPGCGADNRDQPRYCQCENDE